MSNKLLVTIFFCLPLIIFAQFKEQIKGKNIELEQLHNQIEKLEKDLNTLTNKEEKTLSLLKKLDNQNLLLKQSIKKLEIEEEKKAKEISSLNNRINKLKTKIEKLQKQYSDYLVWLYKQDEVSTLRYLLDAESVNQALIRYKHLQYIHEKSDSTLKSLQILIKELAAAKKNVENEKKEKEILLAQKKIEKQRLISRSEQRKNLLQDLKKDKKNVESEIDDKRKMEISIKQMIADLIEKERERERKLRTARLKGEIDNYEENFNYDNFEKFDELKGKLNWPVDEGKISRNFGENKNEKTNTVILNYGVDIKTNSDKNVYAVAEGIVSAIDFLYGFGSIVIITHNNNYRTVYGHLTDINVLEGNKVVAGDVIGKVNESLEGNILHFQIWHDRLYQDPQEWLVKR